MTMPEGHAVLDCGAAVDCMDTVVAAPTTDFWTIRNPSS